MKLPVVTYANLDNSKKLLKELQESREVICIGVHPVELENISPQFRMVVTTIEEYDVLIFGLALLVKTIEDLVERGVPEGFPHRGYTVTGTEGSLKNVR